MNHFELEPTAVELASPPAFIRLSETQVVNVQEIVSIELRRLSNQIFVRLKSDFGSPVVIQLKNDGLIEAKFSELVDTVNGKEIET